MADASWPPGVTQRIAVLETRAEQTESDLDKLELAVYGDNNGHRGLLTRVHDAEGWIGREDERAKEDRRFRQKLLAVVVGGAALNLLLFVGGLMWLGARSALGAH